VLVYVDDIIITNSSSSKTTSLIAHFNNKFSLKDLGPLHYFLGIQVKHYSDGGILLSQSKCIRDLLHKTNLLDSKSQPTPMVFGLKLTVDGSFSLQDPTHYRSIVRALQYITVTRPEISFSVNKVCQFMIDTRASLEGSETDFKISQRFNYIWLAHQTFTITAYHGFF